MIIEISVAVAVLFFAILVFFTIRTLLALQTSLKRVDRVLLDAELKLNHLDPLLRALTHLGELSEKEAERLKNSSCSYCREDIEPVSQPYEWAEWLALSLKLGAKFLKRRIK